MRKQQHLNRQHDDQRRGATLVEFALVLPVFLLFTFAAIEFAHLNTLRNTANNAAYEAARRVVVPGANVDEARDEAARILAAVGTREFNVDVNPSEITDTSDSVTVHVTVPYEKNSLMVPWFTRSLRIQSKATLKTERYRGIR